MGIFIANTLKQWPISPYRVGVLVSKIVFTSPGVAVAHFDEIKTKLNQNALSGINR